MADDSSIGLELPQSTHYAKEAPTVSVIIPAYNAARYIREALDSVSHQTFSSHEVIVINDGSTDTGELEQELKGYPGQLLYIKHENRGAAAARNVGLRSAKGEFVAFLDADDTWLPDFLDKQLKFLKSNNADFVYSDALLTGESESAGRSFMDLQPSRGAVTPENLLAVKVTVLTSTVVARKKCILEVGLFDEGLKRGQDFELWFRLARHGVRFVYQREVLAHHRIVESGLSGNFVSQLERSLAVLGAIKSRGGLTPGEEAALRINLNRTLSQLAAEKGKEKLLGNDLVGATQFFKEARKYRDSWKLSLVCFALRIAPGVFRRFYNRRMTAAEDRLRP